jgi:ribonuclease T2
LTIYKKNLLIIVFIVICRDYTILTLAQTWPQSCCWAVNERYEMNSPCTLCKLPQAGNNWTVHGLWPTNRYGIHPEFCSGGDAKGDNGFNVQLQNDLSSKWPGYKFNVKIFEFWLYQYSKHGTCASDNEGINTLRKYFRKAIDLLDQYNVGKILEDNGIIPGYKYNFNQFSQAIQTTLGSGVYLICAHNSVSI